MARFNVNLKGNKALIGKIKKLSDQAKQMVGDEIEASTHNIHKEAVGRVPVDTGFLKNSITAQADPGTLRGRVEVSVKYAPYVEFGTGGLVDVPQGLEDYAMKFKGKGEGVSMPPQPFLYPAFREEVPKLLERLNKGLKKWN